MSARTPEEWGIDYQSFRPKYQAFTTELERLFTQLANDAGIDVQIEARTKEVESFINKIYRKNEKYDDPINEITDLCGIRTICYYVEDVERVGALIEQEFDVDWPNSERQGADSDPDRFGYRSDHYVVELEPPRSQLKEWSLHQGLKAEIQVRTVMQHAWAAVDHKLRYKGQDLPNELQRRLSRLSALLETADEQFSSIREDSQILAAGYEESFAGGDFDYELDVLSLQGYLRATELDIEWMQRAIGYGYQMSLSAKNALEQPENRFEDLDFSRLIDALRLVGATSIDAVNEYFASAGTWGDKALERILTGSKEAGFIPYALPNDILTFLVLYGAGNLAAVDRTTYRDPIRAGIKAAIRARKGAEK